MARTYGTQIRSWDWPGIITHTKEQARLHGDDGCTDGCDSAGHVGECYLGSVMSLAPSGKFYTAWTTNQTSDDVDKDSRWYAALDKVAEKSQGWIESGEGDPTDLYFCSYWTNEQLAAN
jgi:hypothetical protein